MTPRPHPRSVTALAAGALVLVTACTATPTPSTPVPVSTSPPASASPASPAASATTSAPRDWKAITEIPDPILPAGRLGMTANGRPGAPWAVVQVPSGFSTIDGWVIFDEDPDGGGGVGYWTVSEVARNPCGPSEPMAAGDTVEELVATIQQQRRTRISVPVPVTVDGHDGLSLEMALPADADFTACPRYDLWESDPAGARHMGEPGEFDRLWILDVDGEVVVLTVTANTRVPQDALERLTRMVEGVEFVPRTA